MSTHIADRTPDTAPVVESPAVRLRSRHLLGIEGLSPEEITLILDTSEAMKEVGNRPIKKVPALRGRTVVNLFFEPSTRTRTSFEIAEKRLSADTLSIATATSSVTKGESLLDTVRNLEAMSPDMIVMRHASSGAPHLLARTCHSAIINAGDGMHEHPTQALLDAFTIREHKGRLAGLKVAIIGDLLHSRVLRSNLTLLKTMGAELWVCGPATLFPPGIEQFEVHATTSVDEAVEGADVVMMLRIQHERMHGHFGLDLEAARIRGERLGETARQHPVARQHVARTRAEEDAEQRVERTVAEAVAAPVRSTAGLLLAHRGDHVEVVADELRDHARRTRRVVRRIAVDEHVDVGVDLAEHPPDYAALAGPRFCAHDSAGGLRRKCSRVARAVVVDVDDRLGQRGVEIGDDRCHRRRLVAAGNQDRDARTRAHRDPAARTRRSRRSIHADTP